MIRGGLLPGSVEPGQFFCGSDCIGNVQAVQLHQQFIDLDGPANSFAQVNSADTGLDTAIFTGLNGQHLSHGFGGIDPDHLTIFII